MVRFQVSKTIPSLPMPGTNISLSVPYEHLGFIYNLILESERIFSLSNANLTMGLKTYSQTPENTFL